ncbi:MAG: hypothetical protein SFX73_01160 [Kofleriaceae bacterium]|nr:hypothetical protein [Kofleriaceae bacterium]
MTKLLLSFLGLALLADFAVAQPAAQPAAAPNSLTLALTINHGTDARTYNMLLAPDRCGEVTSVEKDRTDAIWVCAEPAQNGILLRTKWRLRAGTTQYDTKWDAVVARNATVDVGHVGGVRLTLAMK